MESYHINILGLILDASFIVQVVMFILLALAFLAWYLIFQRGMLLNKAARQTKYFESFFWQTNSLSEIYKVTNKKDANYGAHNIFMAGFQKFVQAKKEPTATPSMMLESVHRAMRVELLKEQERLQQSLPLLATIGSASPYIGLFGTVWGIMNAFLSLSGAAQATLQSVAPGIAEALIATAMGLFAAIPAVIGYNRFAAQSEKLLHKNQTFAEEFYAILQKEAHR